MEKFCRCCARKIEHLDDIFKKDGNAMSAGDMFEIFAKIEIGVKDLLPKKICKACLCDLQTAFDFHTRVLQSQIVLTSLLEQLQDKRTPMILPKAEHTFYKCPHCANEFEKEAEFKSHLKNHFKKRKTFKCYECLKSFSSKKLLLSHLKSYLDENICNFCSSFFSDRKSLENHKKNSHPIGKYVCRKCSKEFSSRRSLVLHVKQRHQGCLYFCSDCGDEFQERGTFTNHISSLHTNLKTADVDEGQNSQEDDFTMHEEFLDEFFLNEDNSFELNECWDDISLSFVDDFKEKISQSPSGGLVDPEARYKCPKCGKGFKKQFDLKIHLAHEHNLQTLVCGFCGQSFNRVEELKIHRTQHLQESKVIDMEIEGKTQSELDDNQTGFECRQCGRKYLGRNNLLAHRCSETQHKQPIAYTSREQLFQDRNEMSFYRKSNHLEGGLCCTLCDKSFKTLSGLKYHLRVHTGSKDYCCPYCTRKFTADTNLSSHIRSIHSEVKTHICNLCDGKFATTDHLRKHVTSVHQKERNFLCSTCGKGFAQSSHLKQHLLVHTGERRFQCCTCSRRFFKAADLSRHLAKKHPNCDVK